MTAVSPTRILLFEDNAAIADTVRVGLAHLGYEVIDVLASADTACEKVQDLNPNVILMDVELAGSVDGISAAQEIHRRFGLPIIYTTGLEDEQVIKRAAKAEASGYILKPYDLKELRAAIEIALYKHACDVERKAILEKTVAGSIKMLMEIISVVEPDSFGRGQKLEECLVTLAHASGAASIWEYEVAGVLAQIGFVMIPPSVVRKQRAGVPLNTVEQAMMVRYPEFGSELLIKIPHLESVAQMILYQNKDFNGGGFPKDEVSGDAIPLGGRMLRILGDYLDLQAEGLTKARMVKSLNETPGRYDPILLKQAIVSVIDAPPKGAKAVTVAELKIGQTLKAAVESIDGTLLVAAGNTLTALILKRLGNFVQLSGVKEPIYVEESTPS